MNYYKRLNKDEKKKVKEAFKVSDEGKIYKKGLRIIFLCILGIVLAIGAGIFDYIYKTGTINYVLDGLLLIFSIIYMIKMIDILNKEINKYALAHKKEKK